MAFIYSLRTHSTFSPLESVSDVDRGIGERYITASIIQAFAI